MRPKSALVLCAVAALVAGCGPRRIEKLPVPQENVVQAYRLMAEGDRLLAEGKDHLALLKYTEATVLNPYHEILFNKLAIVYSRLQQFERAERAVERAIGLNPGYAYAHNTQGIIHLGLRRSGDAVKAFRRSIRLRPEAASFYLNLGYAYIQDGKYERGLNAYREALGRDPEILARAETIQLTYLQEEPADTERHYQMARVFATLGDKRSCLYHLGKALASGFSDLRRIHEDDAFESLRKDSDFVALLENYGLAS